MVRAKDEAEAKAKAALIYVAVMIKLGFVISTLFWRHMLLPTWVSVLLLNFPGILDEVLIVAAFVYWLGPADVAYSVRHLERGCCRVEPLIERTCPPRAAKRRRVAAQWMIAGARWWWRAGGHRGEGVVVAGLQVRRRRAERRCGGQSAVVMCDGDAAVPLPAALPCSRGGRGCGSWASGGRWVRGYGHALFLWLNATGWRVRWAMGTRHGCGGLQCISQNLSMYTHL